MVGMSSGRLRRALLAALSPMLLLACSSGSDDGSGSSTDALGESQTAGFVMPSLALAAEQGVFARYANLDPGRLIADNLLFDAVTYFDANHARLQNKDHIAIVDFSKPSGKKRLYVVDMRTGGVVPHMVAHGSGSEGGNGYARSFSDTDGSHMSSLGFVVTGSTFDSSKHGRALLLFGLSSTNAHMRAREIIIHSADYVSETSSLQGHSWGCFALDPHVKDEVVTELANGALLYAGLGKPNAGPRPTAAPNAPPAPPADPTDPTPPTPPADPPADPPPPPVTPSGAPPCTTDGACNPGVDGSGMICVAGQCAPGCHNNNQCPGATTCQAGACR